MSSPSPELSHMIVRAGAGAGKTTELVQRICAFARSYIKSNGGSPTIVVTTFTRKATEELRERLTLAALNEPALLEFVNSSSHIQLTTIHGVLRRFLARFGHRIGLVPNFTLIADGDDLGLRKGLLKSLILQQPEYNELLQEHGLSALLRLLDNYYNEKMMHPELGPLDEAGWMRSIEAEADHLRAQMKSISQRISQATDHEKWQAFASDMNQVAQARRNTVENLIGFREAASKPRNAGKPRPVEDDQLIKDLTDLWKQLKVFAELQDHTLAARSRYMERLQVFDQLGQEWVKSYVHSKLRSGSLRQSDLELLSLELLRQGPEVAETYASSIDHWFIDEFQDTSPVQVKLFDALVGKQPVYIVGDPQQSIYLFRGARSEVFEGKWNAFSENGLEARKKQINYRSRPPLMNFFNGLFAQIASQFEPMTPGSEKQHEGQVARIFQMTDMEGELAALASSVSNWLNAGVEPSEIAVLTRTRQQVRHVAKVLKGAGVPFQTHLPSGFFERLEVMDCLNLLKFLCHPYDSETTLGLLRSPWFRVDDQLLADASADNGELWHALKKRAPENESVVRLGQLLKKCEAQGIGLTWQEGLVESGLLDSSGHHDLSGRREANLWKLVSQLRHLEGKPGFRYLDFVSENLSAYTEVVEESEAVAAFEPNRVNVMTVHKSKGLQFDHVVVPFCGDSPLLSKTEAFTSNGESYLVPQETDSKRFRPVFAQQLRRELNERELSESQRLFYVALTRSKVSVLMSYCEPKKNSWASLVDGHWNRLKTQHDIEILDEAPELLQCSEDVESRQVRGPWASVGLVEDQVSAVTDLGAKAFGAPKIERLEKVDFGVLLHRIFELMKFGKETALLKDLPARSREVAEEAIAFIRSVTEVPLLQVIEQGFVEWGFSFKSGDIQFNGQIDLWAQIDDIIYIVDYKTGDPRYQEEAFSQMGHYAQAIAVENPLNIVLVALYPLSKKLFVRTYEATAEQVETHQ